MNNLQKIIEKYEKKHPKHLAEWMFKFDQMRNATDLFEAKQNIYLIKSTNGFVKIGISQDVYTRMKQIQTTSGNICKLLLLITPEPTIDLSAKYTEKILHKYFKEKRKIGEWFDLSKSDILEVKQAFIDIIDEDNTSEGDEGKCI